MPPLVSSPSLPPSLTLCVDVIDPHIHTYVRGGVALLLTWPGVRVMSKAGARCLSFICRSLDLSVCLSVWWGEVLIDGMDGCACLPAFQRRPRASAFCLVLSEWPPSVPLSVCLSVYLSLRSIIRWVAGCSPQPFLCVVSMCGSVASLLCEVVCGGWLSQARCLPLTVSERRAADRQTRLTQLLPVSSLASSR